MDTVMFDPAGTSKSYIGQQLGNYYLEKLLGTGAFAATYGATHQYLGTLAAIKVPFTRYRSKEIERLYTEARNLANLIHPHIVRFLEFGEQNNIPFLVMEYVPFGTLRQLHPRGNLLPLDLVLSYVRQIASGLQYMHDYGYIHQDLKPENLLIRRNHQVLIGDLGIAITVREADTLDKSRIFGTVPYTAPEQLQGKPGFATDQYALGIMVYEWLCGTRPFTGSSLEIQRKHLDFAPPSMRLHVPTISPAVEHVVLRALAKEPGQRFSSVHAFAKALERAYWNASEEYTVPLKYRTARINYSPLSPVNHISPPQSQKQKSKKRSSSHQIMALLASNLLTGSAGYTLLYAFNIQAPVFEVLLAFYVIFFLPTGALVLKNRQAFILAGSIIIFAALFGLVLHSLVLFLGIYAGLLLFGTLLAFNINMHRTS